MKAFRQKEMVLMVLFRIDNLFTSSLLVLQERTTMETAAIADSRSPHCSGLDSSLVSHLRQRNQSRQALLKGDMNTCKLIWLCETHKAQTLINTRMGNEAVPCVIFNHPHTMSPPKQECLILLNVCCCSCIISRFPMVFQKGG